METFWNIVRLDLFVSWPETFTIWCLAFTLLERRPPGMYARIALLTVVASVYTDSMFYFVPRQLQLLNSLLINAVLVAALFRKLPRRRKIGVFVTSYLIAIMTDLGCTLIAVNLLGAPSADFPVSSPFYLVVAGIYPILIVEWIVAGLVGKGGLPSIRRLFSAIVDNTKSGVVPLVLLIALQLGMLGTVQTFHLTRHNDNHSAFIAGLLYAAILLCMLSLVLVLRLLARTREETARMAQDVYVEEINRMFTSIRGQRHDFLNHVQVMYTMLQLRKYAELGAYMADVVKETHSVNDIVQHGSPALAAFVQAKTAVAVSRGIRFTYELSDDWNHLSTIRMIDIVKIVGNLVNNAFDEAERMPAEARVVHAVLKCLPNHVELTVSNRGRSLNEAEREMIFLPGYTTKADEHAGLGLSIVQERVKHYQGSLTVRNEPPDTTVFSVVLPRKGAGAAAGQTG
jgi:hypothetical protein